MASADAFAETGSGESTNSGQTTGTDDERGLTPSAERQGDGGSAMPRTWHHELPRWLATLNPGRTQREYEKAISYFFETPGVPQELDALGFDLLLAYRGALALRATPHGGGLATPRRDSRAAQLGATAPSASGALPSARVDLHDGTQDTDGADAPELDTRADARDEPLAPGPLAPATVNLRLTALRQFLVHCSLFGDLPQLTLDRIRAALRRLSIERRRPYQVLAEPEWEGFLRAARLPSELRSAGAAELGEPAAGGASVPGMTADAVHTDVVHTDAGADDATPMHEPRPRGVPPSVLPHSRAGLTGERTAQRDHALIALALATGLRAIELASLDVSDLAREWHAGHEEWWLILPDAKTKGQHGGRTLPLAPELVTTLHDYLRATGRTWERAGDRATPLFLSGAASWAPRSSAKSAEGASAVHATVAKLRRLSPEQIRRIVDRVERQWLVLRGVVGGGSADDEQQEAGDSRMISPHALRHSTAIALLEGNDHLGRPPASVEHVRGWLGHFDIRTTQGYLAHVESRKHRRPFTLTPPVTGTSGSTVPASARDGDDAADTGTPDTAR